MRPECRFRNNIPSVSSSVPITSGDPSYTVTDSHVVLHSPVASRYTSHNLHRKSRKAARETCLKTSSKSLQNKKQVNTPSFPLASFVIPVAAGGSPVVGGSFIESTIQRRISVEEEGRDCGAPHKDIESLPGHIYSENQSELQLVIPAIETNRKSSTRRRSEETRFSSRVFCLVEDIQKSRNRSQTQGSPSAEVLSTALLSKRKMGGCVTKGGAAANLSDPSTLSGPGSPEKKNRSIEPSTSLDMMLLSGTNIAPTSPSTRPTDASNGSSPIDEVGGPSLKNRERRRLSLSQSDPARPDAENGGLRGQLLINGQQGGGCPSPPVTLCRNRFQPFDQGASAEQLASGEENVSDDESLPSSDEEAERRQREEANQDNNAILSSPVTPQRECRRLSVSGMPSSMKQDNFENKRQEVKSDTGFFDARTLLSLGIGYACKKGLKPESPNQDDFFIVRIDDWGLYGVFDGHGPYGHDVSNFVQRELPKLIYNDMNFLTNPKEALRSSFVTVHQMLELAAVTHNLFDCSLSGSTATVVLHKKNSHKLYVAHVGDSRCVLGRLSKNGRKVEAVDLTADHKPNSECERKRIVASGGQVRRLEGDIPYRVFLKGRLYPGLAMSRAIGDTVGTQAGVICEPDVNEYNINAERDLFITLCSDGVWEFLSSSDVAEVIFSNGLRGVQTAADIVARESWNRWIQEEGNVVDDITTEIIYLNPEHPTGQQTSKR